MRFLQEQVLVQFWKALEIGGRYLLTTKDRPFGLNTTHEGLCSYRLISVDYQFYVDGESDEYLGLPGGVFRYQRPEFTPNVRYYSCKEYLQRDYAVNSNIWGSLALPVFGASGWGCVGVLELVTSAEMKHCISLFKHWICNDLEAVGLRSSKTCNHLCCQHDKDIKLFRLHWLKSGWCWKWCVELIFYLWLRLGSCVGLAVLLLMIASVGYNISWWSTHKRNKENNSLSNKFVLVAARDQIRQCSQSSISDPSHRKYLATAAPIEPHFMAAQATSIVTMKVKYGDDYIKFQFPVLSGMVDFQQEVAKRLNLKVGTYNDDNDWILIACDEDLQDYNCNSRSLGRNTVTMLVQPIGSQWLHSMAEANGYEELGGTCSEDCTVIENILKSFIHMYPNWAPLSIYIYWLQTLS